MTRIIRRRRQAKADILDAALFIAKDRLPAAYRFLEGIDRMLLLLAEHPQMGRSRDELLPGLRSVPLTTYPYVIFYQRIPRGIEVVRVLSARRDIPHLF